MLLSSSAQQCLTKSNFQDDEWVCSWFCPLPAWLCEISWVLAKAILNFNKICDAEGASEVELNFVSCLSSSQALKKLIRSS